MVNHRRLLSLAGYRKTAPVGSQLVLRSGWDRIPRGGRILALIANRDPTCLNLSRSGIGPR